MNIERKTHSLGSPHQLSLRGSDTPPRARLQDIVALALVIAFGALGNLRPGPVSPQSSATVVDGSATLFKR